MSDFYISAIAAELARPRPRVIVFPDLHGERIAIVEDPTTRGQIFGLSSSVYGAVRQQVMESTGRHLDDELSITIARGPVFRLVHPPTPMQITSADEAAQYIVAAPVTEVRPIHV